MDFSEKERQQLRVLNESERKKRGEGTYRQYHVRLTSCLRVCLFSCSFFTLTSTFLLSCLPWVKVHICLHLSSFPGGVSIVLLSSINIRPIFAFHFLFLLLFSFQ